MTRHFYDPDIGGTRRVLEADLPYYPGGERPDQPKSPPNGGRWTAIDAVLVALIVMTVLGILTAAVLLSGRLS